MTVSTYDPRRTAAGNGATTAFAGPYITDALDLVASWVVAATGVETVKVLNVDYTVSGVDNQAGSVVTYTVAPPAGTNSQIDRDPTLTQEANFLEGEDEPAAAKEQSLDRMVMMIQALALQGTIIDGRAVRVPYGEAAVVIPTIAQRQLVGSAYKSLSFDAAGLPIVLPRAIANYFFIAGVPGGGTGGDGDIAFNTLTWGVYQKAAGAWGLIGTITGATGSAGALWYSGNAAPGGGTGIDGDFYIQTGGAGLGDVYKKIAGVWTLQGNIRGASGAGTGDVVGPAGTTDGRFVLMDGATGKLIKAHTGAPGLLAVKNTIADADIDAATITYGKLAAAALATAAEINSGAASKLMSAAADWTALEPATPAYAASLALDLAAKCEHIVGNLTGAIDLAAPTGARLGQPVVVWLTQDATGSRAITVQSTNWKLGTFTPSTAANKVDMIRGVVKSLAPPVITGSYFTGVY